MPRARRGEGRMAERRKLTKKAKDGATRIEDGRIEKRKEVSSGVRASTRRQTPAMPYQSPESVSKLLRRVVEEKKNTKTEASNRRVQPKLKKRPKPAKLTPKKRKVTPVPAQKATKMKISKIPKTVKEKIAPSTVVKKSAKRKLDSEASPKGTKRVKKSDDNDSKGAKTKLEKKKRRSKFSLTPRPEITCYDKDPTFEMNVKIPSVSTVADSRLLLRSVILGDNKQLKSLLKFPEKISSTGIGRNMTCPDQDVYYYILKTQNLEALDILFTFQQSNTEVLAPFPEVLVARESAGHGSRYMLGHALRQVTVGRGGKEGNAALLKDTTHYGWNIKRDANHGDILTKALELGLSFDLLKKLDEFVTRFITGALENIKIAVRHGHRELAGQLVSEAIRRDGFGFNNLHAVVLNSSTPPAQSSFKSVSVVKKSTYSPRFTPLHCAAINPNPQVIQALLASNPETMILDGDQWSLLHYAAVGEVTDKEKCPMKYLLTSTGLSTLSVTKDGGNTPLHLACQVGRVANVEHLVEYELSRIANPPEPIEAEVAQEDPDEPKVRVSKKNKGKTFLQIMNKQGMNPLHVATQEGHLNIIKILLQVPDIDVNKGTPAQFDKMTPFMIACAVGHLEIVKYFIEKREELGIKLEQGDRRGRTGLIHAVMNGNAHVVSYLLREGVNHLATDSSGNTCVHYAAAYGWYFCLQLLLEAQCLANVGNLWKMTPMAIAFMKGHIGLVQIFLQHPETDVNSPIDDSTGTTLLLQACSATASKTFLDRIKFLVTEGKADCTVTDFGKNNCLHKIVSGIANRKDNHDYLKKEAVWAHRAIEFLVSSGCDMHAENEEQITPFQSAVTSGCFHVLREKLLPLIRSVEPINPISKDGSTILHILNCHAPEAEAELFLKEMQRKIKGQIEAFEAMATTYNKAGFTPLLDFLETFKNTSLTNEKLPRNTAYLSYLLNVLHCNVNAIVTEDYDKRSVLHIACECHHAKEYLTLILEKKPDLEVTDKNGRTPLVAAICNDNLGAATVLINTGASVQVKCGKSGDDVSEQPLLLYLFQRLASRCFSLVPLLIQKGADPLIVDPKTKKTLLNFMASSPSTQSCLDYSRLLIESGIKADAIDEYGRTALHVVVSRRTGETDCTYDLEDLLVDTCPQALAIADKDGRVPLHYAFSSNFHFKATSLMDPIELVSFLVRSMKMHGMRSAIYKTDSWGRIPLHYAACRGSTISCSLLYAESPQLIDLKDNDGNTPLGLSVFYQHEGSSLQFQQMNADFLTVINKDMKVGNDETGLSTKDGNGSEEKSWKLEYEVKVGAEAAKKRKDGAVCTILEQVVRNDWQGVLYLMLEKLENGGTSGVSPGILAAIRTLRLVLAKKLLKRVKKNADLHLDSKEGTVLHVLGRFLNRSSSASPHVVFEVVKDLVSRNIDISALDEFDSSALLYACMSENSQLISLLWNEGLERSNRSFKDIVIKQDGYGRTVFSALFWKLEASYPSWDFSSWAEKFLDFGVNANLTCEYPICLTEFPGERYLRLAHLRSDRPGGQIAQRLTPLINGVILGNYEIVKWLLEQKKFVDVNATDSKGRTAIMHAIKLNDIKMVKLLLNPKGYKPLEDNVPWKQMPFYVTSTKLDLNLEDYEGRGILDYLINPSSRFDFNYANSGAIIRVLKMHKSFPLSSLITASLESAKNAGNAPLVQALQNAQGIPKAKQAKVTDVFNVNQDFKKVELLEGLRKVVDYSNDAETMIDKMLKAREEKLAADKKKSLPLVDSLIGIGYDEYEVVVGENSVPMDCVLTKVDLNYGMFGLYNFYKMQLVKQWKGKEMIMLFTRWGRVGDEGQYQKTPYATLKEAVKTFESIFKAKSGNDWQVMKNEQDGGQPGFVPAPKKYRLVHKSLRGHHDTDGVEIDFDALRANTKRTETELPLSMFELFKEICLDCHSKGLKSIYGRYGVNQLPFGLLDSKAVRRGKEMLKEIQQLLENKEKPPPNGEARTKEEEQTIMESLVEKSGEFFGTIPLYGYQSERLEPIFDVNALRKQENVLANIIHLEIATKLLLAAQLQCGLSSAGIPPLDYIYSSLGINMEALDPADDEGQIILTYILNSSTSRSKVKNIFRVERDEERDQPHGINIGNRWLLWHGTRDVNLLSILHRGLQPVPVGAQLSGHLFGKGIYFADMFAKSEHYCHGSGNNRYMLLCDVALGNVHPVDLNTTMEAKNGLPLGYHSILTTDTRYEPDPGTTISWKGRTIPLGKRTTRILPENKYYGLDYNEYVVFDHAQVRVKYLVQFQG